MANRLMTPDQARERIEALTGLPVPPATIYNWLRAGKLRARRIGWRYFIDQADVDAFVGEAA